MLGHRQEAEGGVAALLVFRRAAVEEVLVRRDLVGKGYGPREAQGNVGLAFI